MKKILICNKSSVEGKYTSMASVFWLQIDRIIAVSQSRGHDVSLVCVDDAAAMSRYGLTPVTSSMDAKQNKDAIDGIFTKAAPDCIVIIGAQDIIPFQTLIDQTQSDEHFIPSDLPYSCTKAFSQNISDFLTPSRVVTRLPDLYGANAQIGMDIFIKTVDKAISVYQQPITAYNEVFCLYAKAWEKITDTTLNDFKPSTKNSKYASPQYTPPWNQDAFVHNIHFINLHGGKIDEKFYGQDGSAYPVAIVPSDIEGGINNGTIALVLCCFGAQLYYAERIIPFANTYLANGAVMFASTVIAYTGEAEEFASIFLNEIRGSKKPTMQSALLQARLNYIAKQTKPLDVYQQKTIAEFVLYGDCGEPYINKNKQEEENAALRQKINHINDTLGFAVFNPSLTVPPEIAAHIEQDRIKGNLNDTSEIKGFDILSSENANIKSEFAQTKQYLVAMTDENNVKHHFVYTSINGTITDTKEYIEKHLKGE